LEKLKKAVPCFHGELVRGAAVACPWEAAAAGARKAMADSGEWHRTAVALSLHRKFSLSNIFSGTSSGFGIDFFYFLREQKAGNISLRCWEFCPFHMFCNVSYLWRVFS
jgi:hypothetical protein